MLINETRQASPEALNAHPKNSRRRSRRRGFKANRVKGRNTKKTQKERLRFYAPPPPPPPVIAGELLTGDPDNFIAFIFDDKYRDLRRLLFGKGTTTDRVLEEFRKATEFHYFGHRRGGPRQRARNPGLLNASKTSEKELLRAFAHRAYRGDPDRRGVQFWGRVAVLLWETHHQLMMLRRRAESAKRAEINRIERIPAMRARRATYMRRYRKRRRRWS